MLRSLVFSSTVSFYFLIIISLASCATQRCSDGDKLGSGPAPGSGSASNPSTSSTGVKGTLGDSGKPSRLVSRGVGHIVYNLPNKRAFLIEAREGATPLDLTEAMAKLGSSKGDTPVSISRDGKFLLFGTERFHRECKGWNCLAIVPIDLSKGETILAEGEVVRAADQAAIASGGNLVVYDAKGDKHERDIWMTRRITGNTWSKPLNLTRGSPYNLHETPKFSDDGSKVVLNCGHLESKGISICEVGSDGRGFKVVLTPANGPSGTPKSAYLRHPDYAPDGSIIFEADWSGEQIWRLSPGAKVPVQIDTQFSNDNVPCVLPGGTIASLWLNRPGGKGYHELKIMGKDGSNSVVLTPDVDILGTAIYCGH